MAWNELDRFQWIQRDHTVGEIAEVALHLASVRTGHYGDLVQADEEIRTAFAEIREGGYLSER